MPDSTPSLQLWSDWCQVTGHDPAERSDAVIARFSWQASPSRAVLRTLRSHDRTAVPTAPAWPRDLGRDVSSLRRTIERGCRVHDHPDSHWSLRLRMRRLLFAAVLLAPPGHGGLGLDRRGVLDLRPGELVAALPEVGLDEDPRRCPACAIRSWCQVLGENSGWSHASVRALGHLVPERREHSHALTGAGGLNRDWTTCPGLLPRIDRWGYLDPYASMHRSSLSVLIGQLTQLLGEEVEPQPPTAPTPAPRGPVPHLSRAEQEEIFARADKVNQRISALLEHFDKNLTLWS